MNYVSEVCRDVFKDTIDAVFGEGNWELRDGSIHGGGYDKAPEWAIPKKIEITILTADRPVQVRYGLATIFSEATVEGDGYARHIVVTPKSIKIKRTR